MFHVAIYCSFRNIRSLGKWNSETQQIELKRNIGSIFRYIGTQSKESYTLNPEEALFLLEMVNSPL